MIFLLNSECVKTRGPLLGTNGFKILILSTPTPIYVSVAFLKVVDVPAEALGSAELCAMVTEKEVELIGRTLVDVRKPLKARFRALFTLRNLGGPAAIEWISRAFGDDSALLKHELAYCLGQMQDDRAIPVLISVLQDTCQEPMVRHEAGESSRGRKGGWG